METTLASQCCEIVEIPMIKFIGYDDRRDWLHDRGIRYFDWQSDGYDCFRFYRQEDATLFRLVFS